VKIERFEDIKTWQEARVLVRMVYTEPKELKQPRELGRCEMRKD
jgi:hypothetical protein